MIRKVNPNTIGIILFIIISVTFSYYPAFSATYQATIVKITDGDTVWVKANGRRVKLRLLGIDTPEEYYSKKMLKDIRICKTTYKVMRKLGLLATKHTETLMHKGEIVTIKTFGRGYYGRILAFIILPNGVNYNEQEVADGYACVYKYHGHKSSQLSWNEFFKLNKLLKQAKRHRKGLWGINYGIMECLCR